MDRKTQLLDAAVTGAIVAALFIVVITIAGELYSPLKDLLREEHYHHWVGKGIWSSIAFVLASIVYFFGFKSIGEGRTPKLLKILSWMLLLGTLILLAFFIYEFFGHA